MMGATCGLGNSHSPWTPDLTPFGEFMIVSIHYNDEAYLSKDSQIAKMYDVFHKWPIYWKNGPTKE